MPCTSRRSHSVEYNLGLFCRTNAMDGSVCVLSIKGKWFSLAEEEGSISDIFPFFLSHHP